MDGSALRIAPQLLFWAKFWFVPDDGTASHRFFVSIGNNATHTKPPSAPWFFEHTVVFCFALFSLVTFFLHNFYYF